jgi:chorismate mutase
MIHANTTLSAGDIRHVYLKGARELRPEWAYSDDEVSSLLREEPVEIAQ